MRYTSHRILFTALLLTGSSALAQMHKVAKPEQVVRAVGVFEWTGDFAKPTASRLIPVSLYIEGKLEDAGIYIARPVPFALLSGNIYELQDAGVNKGILDLEYAKHLQATTSTGDLAYDDGWFGYGSVKPLTAPRKTTTALKPSKTLSVLTSNSSDTSRPHLSTKSSGDSTPATSGDQSKPSATANTGSANTATTDDPDRPTMKRRSADTDSTASSGTTTSTGSTPADDPDRPTMKRHDSSDTTNTTSTTSSTTPDTSSKTTASTTPADDPDRPTMTRRAPTTDPSTPDSGSTTASGSAPSNDPDRPTLKRHTPEEAKKAHNNNDLATVSGTGSLNEDPDRPNLHHGKATGSAAESEPPKLVGIPQNLHQMIAVSDAVNRDPHPFALEWDDPTQRATILQKMQTLAQAHLAAYASTPASSTPAKAAPKPAVKTPTTPTHPTHHTVPPTPPSVPLVDEELKAYTLSYGGAATYIYSAHTAGTGAALRYVTIVAQADGLGELKPAIQSVTDAAHLDRAPQMRFIDVVDAEANNRASLLFELRGQSARQFGLYRVIASHSDQIFVTGTTQ